MQVESWVQAPRGAAWMLPREHPGAIHGSQADPPLPPGVGCVGCMGCTPWPHSLLPARALLLHARLPRELSEFASMKVNSFI